MVADKETSLTYGQIFAVREFQVLFGGNAAAGIAFTMQKFALAALVYAETKSPLLAALAYLAGFAPQVIGALTLMSFADRIAPRAFIAGFAFTQGISALVLASGVLPIWGMFVLVMALGMVSAVGGAVHIGVLVEVLPAGGFVLGRSLMSITSGITDIVGFAAGGIFIAVVGPAPALYCAAAVLVAASVIYRIGLRRRPARTSRRTGSTIQATISGNRRLLGNPATRPLLLTLWIPNGLIVGAETQLIPYAGNSAGILFVTSAAGTLIGNIVLGRWVPSDLRRRLVVPLRVLLAVPYLCFLLNPGTVPAAIAVGVASIGFATSLAIQEQFLAVLPDDLTGQGFGLAGSGLVAFQAISAAIVGFAAEVFSPGQAMAGAAVLSLLATAVLGVRVRARQPSVLEG
jgi:hypothetical protein